MVMSTIDLSVTSNTSDTSDTSDTSNSDDNGNNDVGAIFPPGPLVLINNRRQEFADGNVFVHNSHEITGANNVKTVVVKRQRTDPITGACYLARVLDLQGHSVLARPLDVHGSGIITPPEGAWVGHGDTIRCGGSCYVVKDYNMLSTVPEVLLTPDAEVIYKDSKKQLECAVCLQTLSDAVSGHCNHMLCRHCMYQCGREYGSMIKCPVCRNMIDLEMDVTSCPVVNSLCEILSRYTSEKTRVDRFVDVNEPPAPTTARNVRRRLA
jgi:hypothetical protein